LSDQLGCEGVGPQYGSILLVSVFYFTNFQLVQFIPKPAVSCLMVLSGFDMCKTWLVESFSKTEAKFEWMVAPLIVVLTCAMGMLNAILLGVAISTFIFVANFYQAGTVKYVGSGLSLRSTVERGVPEANWLNQNGDLIQVCLRGCAFFRLLFFCANASLIQILVLQNFLFFGNAQSVLQYVMTMFDEPPTETEGENSLFVLPPKPKYVVIDFAIVTGLDISAVDILREISAFCSSHRCRLIFSGLSPSLKSKVIYAGISPKRAFAPDLESALITAEDLLLKSQSGLRAKDVLEQRETNHRDLYAGDGFILALQKIDEQVCTRICFLFCGDHSCLI
jgi:sulfate permease, SulP family